VSNTTGKKFGLGKGIGSLMDDYTFDAVFSSHLNQENSTSDSQKQLLMMIDINRVHPNPHQPRKQFDPESLEELANSIRSQGILQPLLVEKINDEEYSIIAGERRYRAALSAGLEKIPVIVKTFSDVQRLEVSLIENIQRENLNPIDEAKAYSYLLEQAEIKQDELAERVGKKRSTIANTLRLLQLPKDMQDALLNGEFSAGHARALLSVVNPADQALLYQKIIKDNLSVRAAEQYASELNEGKRASKNKKDKLIRMKSADILSLEAKFLEACGTRVELKGTLEHGKIQISYHSMDDLEKIYKLLSPQSELFEL